MTPDGCDWFEEVLDVNQPNYTQVIDNYYNRYNQSAKRLVEKWKTDGDEKAELYLMVEKVTPIPYEFYRLIDLYVENMGEYGTENND
jgi:hypothetical protein